MAEIKEWNINYLDEDNNTRSKVIYAFDVKEIKLVFSYIHRKCKLINAILIGNYNGS